MPEEQLRIAVFIDFDNIEIGVKSTLSKEFDVGLVLEALKERGEVISKIAYGNWKRHGNLSRQLSESAVHMVQRDPTPRGDKNGADINLALDALEMAFTKPHINAYAIVGGDSDFITLVEKLKQYNKAVFVVGGRAFTSGILQKNCREFISYENLVRQPEPPAHAQAAPRRQSRRGGEPLPIENSVPLMERALKVLAEREHQPLLGLVKSTMLQLDSTFSERDYRSSSFLDFVQKLATAGYVQLDRVDSNYTVKLPDKAVLPQPAEVEQPQAQVRAETEAVPEPSAMPEEVFVAAAPVRPQRGRRGGRSRRGSGSSRNAEAAAAHREHAAAAEPPAAVEAAPAAEPQPEAPAEAAPARTPRRRAPARRRRTRAATAD